MGFLDFIGSIAPAVGAMFGPVGAVVGTVAGSVIKGVAGNKAAGQAADAQQDAANVTSSYADLILRAEQEAAQIAADAEAGGATKARAGTAKAYGDTSAQRRASAQQVLDQIGTTRTATMGALDKGYGEAKDLYGRQIDQGAGGLNYLQTLVASDEARMTPAQTIGLEDLKRQVNNNLATSGMRGSGRAGQAVLADSIRRYIASAMDTNAAKKTGAAQVLAGVGNQGLTSTAGLAANRGQQDANIELGLGRDAASVLSGLGTGLAQDTLGAGLTDAGFDTTLGNIEARRARDSGAAAGRAYGTIGNAQSGATLASGVAGAQQTLGLGNTGADVLNSVSGYFRSSNTADQLSGRMGNPRRYSEWTSPDAGGGTWTY